MNSTLDHKDASHPERSRLRRFVDRLARYGWLVLLGAVALALMGSVVYAATWHPNGADPETYTDECESPPCFDLGGTPSVRDLPVIIPTLGYVLTILFGVPSAVVAVWSLVRRRWSTAGRLLLVFVGPLLVFVGIEVVPHVVSPCFLVSGICEDLPEGRDVKDQWHLLNHTVVGALSMTALYWLALRRWHPAVLR